MRQLPPDPITGEGVVLRPLTLKDADDVAAACDDPETHRFLPDLPDPYTRDHALDWIDRAVPAAWAAGQAPFAVADPETDRLLGSVALHEPLDNGSATSIGYWVAPWARRRGVATAATRALASWAFAQGFGRIELLTDRTNAASMRVALAAGFTHEGVRRSGCSGGRDAVVWSRLAGDRGAPAARLLPDLPGGTLTDGVVTVAPLRVDDADDLFAVFDLPEVRATSFGPVATPASVRERCGATAYQWLIGTRADCAIRDAATGALAGDIGIHLEGNGQAMVGYSLAREWRGKRYATRAVRLLAGWVFGDAGIARLVAGTAPDNVASQRTLERAGFTREAYQRGRLPGPDGTRIDNLEYALLPGDD